MKARKKSKAPEFPFWDVGEPDCETEEQAQALVDRFFAAGGTGEVLAQQLNEALERNPGTAVIFNHDYLPILRAIPDFSTCSAPAVAYAIHSRACCVLDLLVERGADLYVRAEDAGGAPLVIAAQHEDEESALWPTEKLLAAGVDPDMVSADGETPLMHAAAQGHVELARKLIAAGADLTRRDFQGRMPLHWALGSVSSDRPEVVEVARLLIEAGAPVNARDNQRNTPLHALMLLDEGGLNAAASAAAIDLMVRHGADLEARNLQQETPILVAAANGQRGAFLINLLHRAGADVNVKVYGTAALDAAATEEGPQRAVRAIRMGQRIDAAMSDGGDRRSPSKPRAREISPL